VWTARAGFDGDADRFFGGQENGLVGAAAPTGVYLNLARRSGGSRLRITTHDAGADGEFAVGVVDEYVVEIRPAGAEPDRILSTGSENARYWHGEWGGRR
jgi:hypothetical protein